MAPPPVRWRDPVLSSLHLRPFLPDAPMNFSIRDLAGMADMKECEEIEKEVWGFVDLDIVPAGLIAVMGHYGAVTAGAFVGDRLAGFVCGFPGYGDGEPFHHSHMLAVRPEFQGAGIGLALKWAQADRVLAQGDPPGELDFRSAPGAERTPEHQPSGMRLLGVPPERVRQQR